MIGIRRTADDNFDGIWTIRSCMRMTTMKYLFIRLLLLFGLSGITSCSDPTNSHLPVPQDIPVYTYRVVNTYPHDTAAFTQGLAIEDTILYEGTGLNGRSSLRRVALHNGAIERIHQLSPILFGEGITVYNNRIYQLTWTSKMGFVYDKDTFQEIRSFTYPTEGWGLTHDGDRFIMSDGTSILYFRDMVTFEEIKSLSVRANGEAVSKLNELEYVKGEVYANVWQTDRIARINPDNGQVVGWIDLQGLLTPEQKAAGADVLNGIAYDPVQDRLFITGKLWPSVYEIELVEK